MRPIEPPPPRGAIPVNPRRCPWAADVPGSFRRRQRGPERCLDLGGVPTESEPPGGAAQGFELPNQICIAHGQTKSKLCPTQIQIFVLITCTMVFCAFARTHLLFFCIPLPPFFVRMGHRGQRYRRAADDFKTHQPHPSLRRWFRPHPPNHHGVEPLWPWSRKGGLQYCTER